MNPELTPLSGPNVEQVTGVFDALAPGTVRVFTHELVDRTAAWTQEFRYADDSERLVHINSEIQFKKSGSDVTFCTLLSPGNSHLAVVEATRSSNQISVTVFRMRNGFSKLWSADLSLVANTNSDASHYIGFRETPAITGGLTNDGESVFVVYKSPEHGVRAWTVTSTNGWSQCKPPADTAESYSLSHGQISDDGEHIVYIQRGEKFGRNGQGEVVLVYSIRTMKKVKAFTFGFGDGRHLRNTRLLRPLNTVSPVFCAISTSGFRPNNNSPPLICSSDQKVHWNCAGIDDIYGVGTEDRVWVSPDSSQMIFVHRDDGMISHWNLKSPTLKPIGTCQLPGVEVARRRRWRIHDQETTMRDRIPKQVHCCRYSPGSKVVTVVTANDYSVVVNVFLAFNMQLVYNHRVEHQSWPGYVALQIGFNPLAGLSIFGGSPTTVDPDLGIPVGFTGVSIPLPGTYEKIKQVEDYFDLAAKNLNTVQSSLGQSEKLPLKRFTYVPDKGIIQELGSSESSSISTRRQQEYYEKVFATPGLSVRMPSTPQLRAKHVPHLATFNPYAWDRTATVSLFGVLMKNDYFIVAIGPSARPAAPGEAAIPDIFRVLYVSEVLIGKDNSERIKIFKENEHFILSVSSNSSYRTSYSGAPLPMPRWAVISPHFLEEDGWYDTFIIKEAAHGTMPNGWTTTPHGGLTLTTSFTAYYPPNLITAGSEMIDHGHRNSSCYVAAKHAMWRDYGLRGLLEKNRTNEIFFGGGKYKDTLGFYFRMIYDDRTYDDSSPFFASTFTTACNMDILAQDTQHVDAFLRRLHQSDDRVLLNTQSVCYTLPLACRARPFGALSFMRRIVCFPFQVEDVGAVQVVNKVMLRPAYDSSRSKLGRFFRNLALIFRPLLFFSSATHSLLEPNASVLTLPLQGFSSFDHALYTAPPASRSDDDGFWTLIRATYPSSDGFVRSEENLLRFIKKSGNRPASPFTRLVDEILRMKDRETQFSFFRVVWLEKLIIWKLRAYGRKSYLFRVALPMLALFLVHLVASILLTQSSEQDPAAITTVVTVLACVEAAMAILILVMKIRQAYRFTRLFFRSVFNYIDMIALILGLANFGLIVSKTYPPRAFLAFSTPMLWLALILMLRIYERAGMLMLLLTEMIQGVMPFLVLLAFIVFGFTFVPFLLLRNLDGASTATDTIGSVSFSNFGLSLSQMINFMAGDYDALQEWETTSAAVRTLRALYVSVITILLLNSFIALLNLKIKSADKMSRLLWLRQMASLLCEIELGLLTDKERGYKHWFPEWFTYTMSENEKRTWNEYLDRNPLKWTQENNFEEDKDHAEIESAAARRQDNNQTSANAAATATAVDDVTTEDRTTVPQNDGAEDAGDESSRGSGVA